MNGGNYEREDIRVRSILWGIVLLAVGMVVVQTLVWFTYEGFRQTYASRDVRRSQVETAPEEPPLPRLEVSATANFQEYQKRQMEKLNSYGWASREERRARIPIERAMELMLERK